MGNDFCSIQKINLCSQADENLMHKPSNLENKKKISGQISLNNKESTQDDNISNNLIDISLKEKINKGSLIDQQIICEKIKEDIDPNILIDESNATSSNKNLSNNNNNNNYNISSSFNTTVALNTKMSLFPEQEYTFIGYKLNGLKEGFGLQKYEKSSSYYYGKFHENIRCNGICKYINFLDNYEYRGYVNDNYAEGYGQFFNNKISSEYEGYFSKSKKDFIGIETYNDQSTYEGEFSSGKRTGIGAYKWSDGSNYEGEWKENLLYGFGIYKFKGGAVYKGQWQNNQMDGYGEFSFSDNKTYIGFYEEDKKNGFGIMYCFAEGKAYSGFWKNNKQNGIGVYYHNDKVRYGSWKNGTKNKLYKEKSDFINNLSNEYKCYKNIFEMDFQKLGEYIKKIIQ